MLQKKNNIAIQLLSLGREMYIAGGPDFFWNWFQKLALMAFKMVGTKTLVHQYQAKMAKSGSEGLIS